MSTIFLFFYFLLFLMLLRDKSGTKLHQRPRAENDRNSPEVSFFLSKHPFSGTPRSLFACFLPEVPCFPGKSPVPEYTSVIFLRFFARGRCQGHVWFPPQFGINTPPRRRTVRSRGQKWDEIMICRGHLRCLMSHFCQEIWKSWGGQYICLVIY